jgi:hypothetical protein
MPYKCPIFLLVSQPIFLVALPDFACPNFALLRLWPLGDRMELHHIDGLITNVSSQLWMK